MSDRTSNVEFWTEITRIIRITQPKLESLEPETSLEGVDSLGITEVCVQVEDSFGVPMQFDEARPLKTVRALEDLIENKLALKQAQGTVGG